MYSGSMIGAGVHGNGHHWYSLTAHERVVAMKVTYAIESSKEPR